MHMADALVSPAVGGIMYAAAAGAMIYAVKKSKSEELSSEKVPLMGVAGAFVFAAQMVNFTIPATGSSGHIGGGILLAAMLGGGPSYIVMAVILAMQCLFFADGGILTLGANIWNMGFYACLVAFPLIYKKILSKGISYKRITIASILSVVTALQLGAFSVVLETLASGVTDLPFAVFAGLMQPIHLAIGAVEGVVTAAVLCFVYKARPEILENAIAQKKRSDFKVKKVVIALAIAAAIVGGGVSLLASQNPDGLEWAMENTAGTAEIAAEGAAYDAAAEAQESTAFMPDYSFKDADGSAAGTSLSGLVGGLITCGAAAGIGVLMFAVKKKRRAHTA